MTIKQRDYILGLDEYIYELEEGIPPLSSSTILGQGWADVYEQISNEWASRCIKRLKDYLDGEWLDADWCDVPFGVDYEGDAIF